MSASRFIDADAEARCRWTIKLSDGSEAQCGRRHVDGDLCTQHAKMAAAWHCAYCGGNDEFPPDHCVDCTRQKSAAEAPDEWFSAAIQRAGERDHG